MVPNSSFAPLKPPGNSLYIFLLFFFICSFQIRPCYFALLTINLRLDNAHVVFGQVVEGLDVVKKVEATKTNADDAPLQKVVIANCGQL